MAELKVQLKMDEETRDVKHVTPFAGTPSRPTASSSARGEEVRVEIRYYYGDSRMLKRRIHI